jgi:hypothetical protein
MKQRYEGNLKDGDLCAAEKREKQKKVNSNNAFPVANVG